MVKYTLKQKVLKYLIENKEPTSIKSISDAIKTDYKNTFTTIKTLEPLISKQKLSNLNLITLAPAPEIEILQTEQKRTEEFLLKNKKIKFIQEDIEELNYPFIIGIIFGSYAKNTNTKNSDIDLCVICDNEENKNKIYEKISIQSLKIELHEFTIEEFISMLKTIQLNVGHEIVKNNIILFGAENYYSLISKWMKEE